MNTQKKTTIMDALFYAVYVLIFIPVIAMLIIGIANAEVLPTDIAATADGMVYDFTVSPGEEFYYTLELFKTSPAPQEPGETEIESWVFTLDEDDELPDLPRYYNWVEVEETRMREDGFTEVLFYVAIPGDLPAGTYEFTAVTANLEPQLGTNIIRFNVK